jgi:hypothetical protein
VGGGGRCVARHEKYEGVDGVNSPVLGRRRGAYGTTTYLVCLRGLDLGCRIKRSRASEGAREKGRDGREERGLGPPRMAEIGDGIAMAEKALT